MPRRRAAWRHRDVTDPKSRRLDWSAARPGRSTTIQPPTELFADAAPFVSTRAARNRCRRSCPARDPRLSGWLGRRGRRRSQDVRAIRAKGTAAGAGETRAAQRKQEPEDRAARLAELLELNCTRAQPPRYCSAGMDGHARAPVPVRSEHRFAGAPAVTRIAANNRVDGTLDQADPSHRHGVADRCRGDESRHAQQRRQTGATVRFPQDDRDPPRSRLPEAGCGIAPATVKRAR